MKECNKRWVLWLGGSDLHLYNALKPGYVFPFSLSLSSRQIKFLNFISFKYASMFELIIRMYPSWSKYMNEMLAMMIDVDREHGMMR